MLHTPMMKLLNQKQNNITFRAQNLVKIYVYRNDWLAQAQPPLVAG